jgi:hypothetical protein
MARSGPDTIGSFLFGQARASRVRFWHIASLLLCTFAPPMEEAVDEAKQSIDCALDNRRPD